MPVVLLTDALFFVLIVVLIGGVVHLGRHPETARPWRKLATSRSAMLSVVVLLVYLFVALLDSLHFRPRLETGATDEPQYAAEVISVLDVALTHLRSNTEKTYSRPLAAYSFVKEVQYTEQGVVQDYPRLKHGGAHLSDPERERAGDLLGVAAVGLLKGLVASMGFVLLLCFVLMRTGRRSMREAFGMLIPFCAAPSQVAPSARGDKQSTAAQQVTQQVTQQAVAWGAVVFTAVLIIVCVAVLAELSFKYHVFGTDKVGQDVLYQAVKSIRTAVLIGTLTTLILLPLALALGVAAGYFLGWVDDVVQYIYTTLNAIPGILLIAAAILMMNLYMDQNQARFSNTAERIDLRLFFLCMILGVTSWSGLCRLLRAETLKVKSFDYIAAARVLGVSHFMVLLRHVLPNVMHIVLITIALDFSGLVLTEAVLSYIDIGVDPAMHSWGNMINAARLEMAREPVVWWSLGAALVFMFTLVLCANLFADAVRDAFDPRMVGRR